MASNIVEGGAFWWADRSEPTPDLQFHFLPGAGVEKGIGDVPSGNGCTLNTYSTRSRSRGIEGLRVCDSSVMPRLISSNTNAAAIMIGEKGADLIRGNRSAVDVDNPDFAEA